MQAELTMKYSWQNCFLFIKINHHAPSVLWKDCVPACSYIFVLLRNNLLINQGACKKVRGILEVINTTVTVVYISIIYIYRIELFCNGTSLKKSLLAMWGLEPASLESLNRHAKYSTIIHPPPQKKKDASTPELSNTVHPIRPNINSLWSISVIFEVLKLIFSLSSVHFIVY